jgi:biotin transport system substrate-specific component
LPIIVAYVILPTGRLTMDLILHRYARAGSLPLADKLVLSTFFLLATALGAFVAIPLPFTPVPLTLQTFFVLLSGAYLGRRWGAGVQVAYLLVGGAGIPFFAAGAAGAAILAGPTAGYLVGFAPAAWLAGWLLPRCSSFVSRTGALLLASLLILAPGTAWLGFTLALSPSVAMAMGFLPFLAGDLLKCGLAAMVARNR